MEFLQDFEKKVEIEAAKLRARTKDGDGRCFLRLSLEKGGENSFGQKLL